MKTLIFLGMMAGIAGQPSAEFKDISSMISSIGRSVVASNSLRGVCIAARLRDMQPNDLQALTSSYFSSRNKRATRSFLRGASKLKLPGYVGRDLDPAARGKAVKAAFPEGVVPGAGQCLSLLELNMPAVTGRTAYFLGSLANPCGYSSVRGSLEKQKTGWAIVYLDYLSGSHGPPGCGEMNREKFAGDVENTILIGEGK